MIRFWETMKRMGWRTGFVSVLLAACSSESAKTPPGGTVVDGSFEDAGHGDSGSGDAKADVDAGPVPFDGPPTLAATGLYADILTGVLADEVLEYDVRYPLWSDGSEKSRYLALPPGQVIDTSNMDFWKFPVGTRAWKEFRVGAQRIETRYLEKLNEQQGGWLEVSYVWNAEQSDALPTVSGETNVAGTTHDVPGSEDCRQCHDGVGDVLIGVSALQLSGSEPNGLSMLAQAGKLSAPPAGPIDVPGQGVVQDALGYLHAQCGHCHNDRHFLADIRVLRLRLSVLDDQPENTPTYLTSIGQPMNHVVEDSAIAIVAGNPAQSQLYLRMAKRDLEAMPPLGTELVDTFGIGLIAEWIIGLP